MSLLFIPTRDTVSVVTLCVSNPLLISFLLLLRFQLNTHEEPMILVRRHAVIISLSPLRAIVTADRTILSVPDGADALLYVLHDYFHGTYTLCWCTDTPIHFLLSLS